MIIKLLTKEVMILIVVKNEDVEIIKILTNEFLVNNEVKSKDSIPIELLKYLREKSMKIEDGALFNELSDLIERQLSDKGLPL